MLIPFVFEDIATTQTTQVSRAKVAGGWLVYTVMNSPRGTTNLTCNFVKDPLWTWSVKDDAPQTTPTPE